MDPKASEDARVAISNLRMYAGWRVPALTEAAAVTAIFAITDAILALCAEMEQEREDTVDK
jgi:hypothetical protein